jgi:Dual specificity phosphatase, catalytic domain
LVQSRADTNNSAKGVSRSAAAVIAYLIKHKNMSFWKAYDYALQKRQKIRVNFGFIIQLQAWAETKSVKPGVCKFSAKYRFWQILQEMGMCVGMKAALVNEVNVSQSGILQISTSGVV